MDLFKDQIGGELASQAGKFLGVSENNVNQALGGMLPGLLGGLIDKGSTSNGASGILDFLNKNNMDGSALGNLGGMFGGGSSTDKLMSTGSSVLKFVMGDKVGALVDFATNMVGIKSNVASSLLRMAAPMLLGLIGKQVKSKNLNASGLMNLLLGQREHVAKAAPAGLGDILGFSAFGSKPEPKKTTSSTTSTRVDNNNNSGGGFGKFLPWIIGLLALAALAKFGPQMCSTAEKVGSATVDAAGDAANAVGDVAKGAADMAGDAAKGAADMAGDAANAVGDAAGAVVDAITSIRLPGGVEIKTAAGSFTDRFAKFVGDSKADLKTAYAFDRVNFATGSANLTPDSKDQIANLAAVLKAYPNVNIEIGGHTDNTGDAAKNLSLSQQRALAVSQMLQQLGVKANRVAAKGYGQNNPIATNATDAGKAANRRVEVRVTKR